MSQLLDDYIKDIETVLGQTTPIQREIIENIMASYALAAVYDTAILHEAERICMTPLEDLE